jgi:hypothetical protein
MTSGTIGYMSHIVEVDQSGKIEDTSQDTALAFSNGEQLSLVVRAPVKRRCVQILRANGYTGKTLYLQLFVVLLFFLLKGKLSHLTKVIIDIEYMGKERQIREYLLNLLHRRKVAIEPHQIQFHHIGKKSPAHALALATLRKRKAADLTLGVDEILREFGLVRKTRRLGAEGSAR